MAFGFGKKWWKRATGLSNAQRKVSRAIGVALSGRKGVKLTNPFAWLFGGSHESREEQQPSAKAAVAKAPQRPATPKQLSYLKRLGYSGRMPETTAQASAAIDEMKDTRNSSRAETAMLHALKEDRQAEDQETSCNSKHLPTPLSWGLLLVAIIVLVYFFSR